MKEKKVTDALPRKRVTKKFEKGEEICVLLSVDVHTLEHAIFFIGICVFWWKEGASKGSLLSETKRQRWSWSRFQLYFKERKKLDEALGAVFVSYK